ncbi:MAG: (2Fe-2S)-binding protein [Planctomycetes bacterium]|nr:(2Fe-2S)-binding protein [Planctomycetota bacterium]
MNGRIDGIGGGAEVTFVFADKPVAARAGESLAMALWAAGRPVLRHSSRDGAPRGVLCNLGICYECLVLVDGVRIRCCHGNGSLVGAAG